jgi:release factor glutamine methyltransferase
VTAEELQGKTVEAARRGLTAHFATAGIDSAELDARLLIGAALGLDLTGLIASAARQLNEREAAQLEAHATRRIDGEPVARILGAKEFWGLPLKLSEATLVPRPDTETVVELALDIARAFAAPIRIIDIGTGSGAILLALLSERRDATGVGTDVSLAALATARRNARDLELAARARFVACDYAAALAGSFDLIVSNPPYIRTSDIPNLAPDVRNHDPRQALDGGPDGLEAYRALIPQAASLLQPGGALVVEAGLGQSPQIEALMTQAGLKVTTAPKADLGGILRAVAARKMPP